MTATTISEQELLERKADIVLARFLRTVDALDRRRHRATEIRKRVVATAERTAIALAAGTVLVALGALVGYALHRRAMKAFW